MAVPSGGLYRVGPHDFFTPGDLAADAETLFAQVKALDAQLDGNMGPPQDWYDAWLVWYAKVWGFYSQTFGGTLSNLLAALNDSNRDELVTYEVQFEKWALEAERWGAQLPDASRVRPREKSGDSLDHHLENLGLPSLEKIGIFLGVLVAGYTVYKVVK